MKPVLVLLSSNGRRGAELQGIGLAAELRALGTETDVAALAPASTSIHLDVEVLGEHPLRPSTLRALRGRAKQASVVIGYGSKTLPACAIAMNGISVPFIYRSIGSPSDWVRGRAHRWRTRLLMRRAQAVVALWPGAASQLRSLYGLPASRISIVPNARSVDDYAPASSLERAEARSRLGVEADQHVVAWIGSLSSEKRPDLVPEIAATLPDLVFVMAGDGPMRTTVRDLVDRCSGRVQLLGQVSDIRSVLAASDLVISTSRTEGMPGTIIEAALMGIPAVATGVGATAEVVARVDQIVSADTDALEFSNRIRSVLSEVAALGPAARSRAVDNFSWQVVAPQWKEIIDIVRADQLGR